MKRILIGMLLCLCINNLPAQNQSQLWTQVSNSTRAINFDRWVEPMDPTNYLSYNLNLDAFKDALDNAPQLSEISAKDGVLVYFPMANGKIDSFMVYESSVLDSDLQSRHPNLKSYVGYHTDNRQEKVYFSITTSGLKGMFLNTPNGTQYLDSVSKDRQGYIVYRAEDLQLDSGFECLTDESGMFQDESNNRNADDGRLREYDLALACTEEYSTYYVNQALINGDITTGASDAEKKAAVLAAMVDIMTRINGVFMNELSIKMNIVANNENIIFLEDTFLSNDDLSELINESQSFIDSFLGQPYDMGHMLCTSSGGLAQVFSVCASSGRARAASGTFTGSPAGLVHENIIRHEMGHQFGAFHTYNSDQCAGAPTGSTAVEPGGGTTIMSYAGICSASSNIIPTNDLYFHQVSLQQIWNFVSSATGGEACANLVTISNRSPNAIAGPDYTIPIGTPYKLVGSSTDGDGTGSHTFCWEQFDTGPAGLPTNTTASGPILRSFQPSTSNTRFIPKLSDYLNNVDMSTAWEKLVVVDRNINFKLTVRDNGVDGGQVGVDDMVITVTSNAGPFVVTSQSSSGSIFGGGSTQTVTWDVANTDTELSEANVNILLSTDGGLTYGTTLASNTANDGTENIVLPNIAAPNCRIMVAAATNVFYNINQENFRIRQTLGLSENTFSESISLFPNPNKGSFKLSFNSISQEDTVITIYDLKGRKISEFEYQVNGRFEETINLGSANSGIYLVEVLSGTRKGLKKLIIE